MEILVLTETVSPRLKYIFNHILSNMLGLDVAYTQNPADLQSYKGPSISYSDKPVANAVHVTPHKLLTLKGIESQTFGFFTWNQLPAFFPTNDASDIPFDIFAASFFLITRYEEYLDHSPDKHARFRVEQSVAYKNNFLEIPLVDLWVIELSKIIKGKNPDAEFKKRSFEFLPTIDIDNAFAYLHKGPIRSFAGTGVSFFSLKYVDFIRRLLVYMRLKPDPNNTYRRIFLALAHFPSTIWFILGGKYNNYDRAISLSKKPMRKLLQRIKNHFIIGIHPSYASGASVDKLKSELDVLTRIINANITDSRQHYLRVFFPNTYKNLVDIGILRDFSLGYSNAVGFRASTCTPIPFFDLTSDNELPITLIPFQVMDRALLDGLKLNPEQAVRKTIEIAQKIKEVDGVFVLAWHNDSLSGINEWKGWENVLGEIVKGIKSLN